MAVYLVNTLKDEVVDDDKLSLREAIEQANAGQDKDVINFTQSLSGKTIKLKLGALTITDNLKINGLGANRLTIDANNESEIFMIQPSTS